MDKQNGTEEILSKSKHVAEALRKLQTTWLEFSRSLVNDFNLLKFNGISLLFSFCFSRSYHVYKFFKGFQLKLNNKQITTPHTSPSMFSKSVKSTPIIIRLVGEFAPHTINQRSILGVRSQKSNFFEFSSPDVNSLFLIGPKRTLVEVRHACKLARTTLTL